MAELTPMMRQYLEIKEQNKDSILFFRLGDFYEMFGDDAKTASRELDLMLTTRDKDKTKSFEEKVPMCGIPYHASDAYIARLISKGYKVAICEQTEDPAQAKGLVKRDIIRVITPGTVIDETSLEAGRSNFCAGIWLDERYAALCACDISTGQMSATAFEGPQRLEHLLNELGRFSPAEAVMNDGAFFDETLTGVLESKFHCHREKRKVPMEAAERLAREQFGEDACARLPRENPAAVLALGTLLNYLHETQKTDLSHIDSLDFYRQGQFMELDLTARRNLELTETLRGKGKRGSLLWVLDKTKTAMGARCLRGFLERPLLDVNAIRRRQGAVQALVDETMTREELLVALTGIGDMERLMGRIVYGTAGGRDLAALKNAALKLPAVRAQLEGFEKGRLRQLHDQLDTLSDIAALIGQTLVDEPPFSVREGEMIREGYDPEVDRLRDILHGGKGIIASMEACEKERTGIKSLKDAKGKVVNIGNPGSGNRQNAIDVFEAAGINIEKDLKAESIKAADAPRMLQDGRIDGFFYTVGHPNGNIKEATAGKRKTRIVSITDIEPLVKKFPYYSLTNIDMAQYPEATNANEKVTTVGMLATFVTSAKVPDDVVYAITKEVFENLDEFKKLHPALEGLTRETMLEGLTAPIHPGALKYYKEAGLMK